MGGDEQLRISKKMDKNMQKRPFYTKTVQIRDEALANDRARGYDQINIELFDQLE